MGCNCGKKNKSSPHCNLCGLSSSKFYPWGTKHKICWRCHDEMDKKLKIHKREIDRITNMLNGKSWTRKEYEEKTK